jgi:hypothetical protein
MCDKSPKYFFLVVVWKLDASCCWNCGLNKLSTILEMKTMRRQPVVHATAWNFHLYKSVSSTLIKAGRMKNGNKISWPKVSRRGNQIVDRKSSNGIVLSQR